MIELIKSQIFITVWAAWIVAHLIKFTIRFLKKEDRNILHFFGSGGFPSAHTTLVTALFIMIGMEYGWSEPLTSLAGIMAVIVIYDALNVRFQAGLHAKVLNKLGQKNPITGKPFKEEIGHTYIEVTGGLVLGIAFAVLSAVIF